MKYMLIAQCNGYRIMPTSAFRLVPCKPSFHYAVSQRSISRHKESVSLIAPQQGEDTAFVLPGFVAAVPVATGNWRGLETDIELASFLQVKILFFFF